MPQKILSPNIIAEAMFSPRKKKIIKVCERTQPWLADCFGWKEKGTLQNRTINCTWQPAATALI